MIPRTIITWLCAICLSSNLFAAETVDMAKRAEELKSLRWGMFICWSFSTFYGKEAATRVKDVSFFRATNCDTDQWAKTAKEAGMGYILFLTKHHDGFCLWDTKTTDRKVTKAPLGRDVLAEVRKSCDKYGIKLALYYSEGEYGKNEDPNVYHPGGFTPEMKKAQLKELLTQYGPVEYIWFDHARTDGGLSHQDTTAFCKSLQPGCIIGYNNGVPCGDIHLGELGSAAPLDSFKKRNKYDGYLLSEFTYPILPKHTGGADWFYSLPEHDNLCKPAKALYKDYLRAVKYDCIFSIDIGPNYEGKIRDIDVKTLREVGEMIRNKSTGGPVPLSQDKPTTASSTWSPEYGSGKALDGDDATRWGAASGRDGWLAVDLGQECTIGRVMISEIAAARTLEFIVEGKDDGGTWKTLVTGTTIGDEKMIEFPAVQARHVRLNILKAKDTPTINEFQVFAPGAK